MKVIGIAGPSCSGKSTVAKILASMLDTYVISLDEFYKTDSEKIFVEFDGKKYRTFERPELYDGERIAETITELRKHRGVRQEILVLPEYTQTAITYKRKPFVIVEGFYLFNYPELFNQIDHKFYIDITDEEVLSRRAVRGGRPHSDESFIKVGMKEYNKYGLHQRRIGGVHVLNGTFPPGNIAYVINKIMKEHSIHHTEKVKS